VKTDRGVVILAAANGETILDWSGQPQSALERGYLALSPTATNDTLPSSVDPMPDQRVGGPEGCGEKR
jgi:hypothetical protein